ncbi:MAG TPA: septum formation family protein [Propionicimonas sp.]|nr:septum formation family protein [Propionicimonas sp.]HQA77430.1 septum formation family protein [Propionicimonas sp.]HQD96407.1 septum formation family protein [Propionicimonas sp.]
MQLRRAAVVLALGLALAGCTSTTAPSPSTPTSAPASSAGPSTPAESVTPEVPAATVSVPQVGECTGPVDLSGASIASLTAIPCAQPHYYEVQARVPISGDAYPGAEALGEQAMTKCSDGFADYVGAEPGYSRYSSAYVVPDEVAWATPANRVITCLVGSADGGLTGSAKGDFLVFPKKGQCTGPQDVPALELELIDCASEHHYEVFAASNVKGKKAPTDAEVEKLFASVCLAGFQKFVGVAAGQSKYEVTYFIASAELWEKVADHRIVCSAGSPKGGVKGSLKGVKK